MRRQAKIISFAAINGVSPCGLSQQADMIMVATMGIQRVLNKSRIKTQMFMQVHDEMVFEVPVLLFSIFFD